MRDFNNIERRAVIKFLFSLQGKAPKEIQAILTETLACFLLGRPKDLSAPLYYTNHPDERAHEGTAVIIRQNIKHNVRTEYRHESMQAASIAIEDSTGETTISAIYCPHKHHN